MVRLKTVAAISPGPEQKESWETPKEIEEKQRQRST